MATRDDHVGLALLHVGSGRSRLLETVLCGRNRPPAATLAEWIDTAPRALLAIDAPLGWPATLGDALRAHHAGAPLQVAADDLFCRETDRDVRSRVHQKPLDVGADRIARTAHAALKVVNEIRERTGLALAMAWRPDFDGAAMIEVYPAATLKAMGLPSSGYKKPVQRPQRRAILDGLAAGFEPAGHEEALLASADVLDACVCALAGVDFLRGLAGAPRDAALARREGWIWVRNPAPTA